MMITPVSPLFAVLCLSPVSVSMLRRLKEAGLSGLDYCSEKQETASLVSRWPLIQPQCGGSSVLLSWRLLVGNCAQHAHWTRVRS